MKSWIFGVLAFATTFSSGVAFGCPTGVGFEDEPVRRPIVQVSFQELVDRASRLESAASQREIQAEALDRSADRLANRARILRQQAALTSGIERSDILAAAEELASRSIGERQRASRERSQARQLRVEASLLRQEANQLVGNRNDNWRRRRSLPNADTTI